MRLAIVNKDKMDQLTIDNINLKEQVKVEIEKKNEWNGTATRRWDEILTNRKEIDNLKHQVARLTRKRNARGAFVKQN